MSEPLPETEQTPDLAEQAWYVLRVMPQHERKIAQYLERLSFEYFLPLVPRKRKWSDRVKIVEFPLFPGYVFVRMRWFSDYVRVLSHPGALYFIKVDNRPTPLGAEHILNLRLLVAAQRELHADPAHNFPPGSEVEIRFGPLKGVRGVVARAKSKTRIYVRVPLLDQMVSAEVDVLDLEPVSL
ncbi:MAG: UpxY family transcription antiterminator [Spirochaetales bacterium]|nr:UpxY family transcription antiterminator [Leptospiraceae bacterium]MCP5482885.1 UpxY family transcription antiterminator [Spirochaetales bacterium]